MGDYKDAKQAFVSGMTGSSVGHINMVSLVALSSISLYSALRSRLPASRAINLPVQWLILVLPLLLSMTLFANSPGVLSFLLLLPTGFLLFLPARESGTPLPSSQGSPRLSTPASLPKSSIPFLPAVTTYRTHMMLMTILAILAVDFPVFPRSLAKCETFGVSLMDLGVGSFIFSQGLVSALPILKDTAYLTAPLGRKLVSVTRKMLPIVVLGLVRVLLVKGTEYPEHESEYGAHWNFFITLALLPILQVVLHPLILHVPISLLGVGVALLHQASLSLLGAQAYVLTTPRTTLISANKEGIVSLIGYLAIHLLGLSAGTVILPPSPSFFRRQQQARTSKHNRRNSNLNVTAENTHAGLTRQNDKTATELCSYSVVWWALFGLTRLLDVGGGVSRQMANLSYVLWVVAFNTSFILGYFLLDMYFFPSPRTAKTRASSKTGVDHSQQYFLQGQDSKVRSPALFEAINKNGLAVFLIANVATGLINLTIETMYVGDRAAMMVLSLYAMGICGIAWGLGAWRGGRTGII